MTIQQAIKQAGEGGKITSVKALGTGYYWEIRGWGDCGVVMNQGNKPVAICSLLALLADDWEVVVPDIEVGDVVRRMDTHDGNGLTGKVTGINHAEQAVIIYKGNTFGVAPLDKLALIRKGGKKHIISVGIGDVYTDITERVKVAIQDIFNGDATITITEMDK